MPAIVVDADMKGRSDQRSFQISLVCDRKEPKASITNLIGVIESPPFGNRHFSKLDDQKRGDFGIDLKQPFEGVGRHCDGEIMKKPSSERGKNGRLQGKAPEEARS